LKKNEVLLWETIPGGIIMTQTTQFRSLVVLNETGKNSQKNKPETEDNAKLLLAVYQNLNELYERLIKLNNAIVRRTANNK
jgi:hypothetical protein